MANTKRAKKFAIPQPVNFYANPIDLQCYLLACAGWTTKAIVSAVKTLTESQVMYRIGIIEKMRRDKEKTLRAQYRDGSSPIAKAVLTMMTAKNSFAHQKVIEVVEKRGLYDSPKSRGVLKDNKSLPKLKK